MELLLLKLIAIIGSISYLGLFIFIAFFSFLAVSSEFVLIGTGVLVSRDVIHFFPSILVAYAAVIAADLLAYFIGWGMHHGLKRISFLKKVLNQDSLYFGRLWFNRYGVMSIPVARFIMGIRFQTFVFAGIMRMNLRKFLFYDSLANLLFTPLLVFLGYKMGDRIVALLSGFKTHPVIGIAVMVFFIVGFPLASKMLRKKTFKQNQ